MRIYYYYYNVYQTQTEKNNDKRCQKDNYEIKIK